jgi:hypothetical protein
VCQYASYKSLRLVIAIITQLSFQSSENNHHMAFPETTKSLLEGISTATVTVTRLSSGCSGAVAGSVSP